MYKQWKENEIKYLKENYGIVSLSELANYFNTTINSVKRCAERYNIKSSRAWTDKEIAFLQEHYKDMTYKELSMYLQRSKSAIDIKINRLGLVKSKYVYNHDFFENINTEEKAYWCGFIMADGGVCINTKTKSSELYINLQADDNEHLKKFNKSINGNIPITFSQSECNLNQKIQRTCHIRIYSEKMVSDLTKYGVIPNKSLIKSFPKNISDDFMWHYIRGYYDGNGCIVGSKNPDGYVFCCFYTGSLNFALGLKSFLNQNNIKTSKVYHSNKDSRCLTIKISGLNNVDAFLHKIYDNSNIYLERKKSKKENIYNYLRIEQRLD